MIYFTADLHLGHQNVIKYCHRPFDLVEEMDSVLIENINKKVQREKDELYILGDFAITNCKNVVSKYRQQVKCKRVHLILGNHDPVKKSLQPKKWLHDFFEIVAQMHIVIYNKANAFFLCHYPLACSFPTQNWGGIHLYGHVHNNQSYFDDLSTRRMNIGVDNNLYQPLSAEEILEKFK